MKDGIGRRVLIKSDLGPGRLNEEIVRPCKAKGLYFKFGSSMPSGSSVNQEQDQLFGQAVMSLDS